MRWWLVVLIVLAILLLIGQVRLGGTVCYNTAGLTVSVLIGPFHIRVLPAREKPDKPKKRPGRKKKRARKQKTQPEKKRQDGPGTVSRLLDLLPVVREAAGALRRKILIHHLDLKVIWAADNPAAAAIGFGRAHAVLGMIWPIFDHNFRVKRHQFQVDVDYEAHRPEVAVDLALTMTLGQILAFALHYGGKALIRWTRSARSRDEDRRHKP